MQGVQLPLGCRPAAVQSGREDAFSEADVKLAPRVPAAGVSSPQPPTAGHSARRCQDPSAPTAHPRKAQAGLTRSPHRRGSRRSSHGEISESKEMEMRSDSGLRGVATPQGRGAASGSLEGAATRPPTAPPPPHHMVRRGGTPRP